MIVAYMKIRNSLSQKILILHKINKKGYFKQKCQASEKYVHFFALNTWLGFLLHELLHQCGVAWRHSVALLRYNRSPGCFAFKSSALLGLVSLIFLLTIPRRFSMEFRSGEFAGQSSTVTPWSLNQLLVPLSVWTGAKSCWKMKSASPSLSAEGTMKCSKMWWLTLTFRQSLATTWSNSPNCDFLMILQDID